MATRRLEKALLKVRCQRRAAFIPYLTAGYPSLPKTAALVRTLERAGADVIELGFPFSDPLADGPTIQWSSAQALAKGVKIRQIFRLVRSLRRQTQVPLVAMSYANLIDHYGVKAFCRDAIKAGLDGVIVPDLPPEEASELVQAARKVRLATIFLAAPTSSPKRLRQIARLSRGFIYFVSLTGVTGARRQLPKELNQQVRRLKKMTSLPVAVGFGVSNPAQVKQLARVADGVIVGSAIIQAIRRSKKLSSVGRFARSLSQATQSN